MVAHTVNTNSLVLGRRPDHRDFLLDRVRSL